MTIPVLRIINFVVLYQMEEYC